MLSFSYPKATTYGNSLDIANFPLNMWRDKFLSSFVVALLLPYS